MARYLIVGKINKTNRTMKKIGLLLGIMLSAVVTFAQEEKTADLFAKELGKYYRDKGNAIYKEAADIIAKTQTVTDAKQMDKLKAQAKAKFMEAKPLIEKAIEIYPKDKNSKAILEGIEKNVASL